MVFGPGRLAFLIRAVGEKLLSRPGPGSACRVISAWLGNGETGACNRMQKAVVRCVPSESKLSISFTLVGSQKHMQRDQSEQLGRVLSRIASNALKGQSKKSKKNRTEQPAAVEPLVRLSYGDKVVAEDVINADAWQDGAVLEVGDVKYLVERNPPTFKDVELPRYIMAGFPVCPKLQIEFGKLEESDFQWYKAAKDGASADAVESWVEAGSERVFIPTNSDIGLKLKLRCRPGNSQRYGSAQELEVNCTVEAGPGNCAFDNRHLYTKKIIEESLIRIVSYNILADVYAQTDYSKDVLYPYCAPYALQIDYRQNLIKKELTGYNADIICLQEVDKTVFSDSLTPALDAFGFEGVFRIKEKQMEGLSTFFRRSKFSLLSQHDITFTEALLSDPLHKDLLEKLCTCPTMKEKFLQRSSALQVSVLQSTKDPSRKICVANTHLYFHPKGANIRLTQIAVALSHIKHVACDLYLNIPVVFCGDFNSIPSSGLYHFIKSGTISEHHDDWVSNGEEERCNMSLTHPLKLESACGEPAYTNYVGGFHGCLDYIFIDSNHLEVEQVIPMPSHEEVTTHQALPSVSHPSDHIALVCDVKWK
ncbi:2',5'-phosphodiesterase 12 [Microcaecilia unicolor]|uniref:2',5'-phosphodiesterase 12 n=1 Tax=Microcaecilia unicolor TaxID=1415580 RepID=A0A6P7Y8A5_9AMPH|nr:2',5'-phosphodiesterase 12 [Microcaecilia unicolor]